MEENFYNFEEVPNEKYKQLFDKFKEIENLSIKEWKVPQILGYFCKKYYNEYNIKYKFKFNTPSPSKSFEIFQIKRLSCNLSKDPLILKNYIDWVFSNKVKKSKRRLTSISFLTDENTINDYKINYLLNNNLEEKITRSTLLPNEYIIKFIKSEYPIKTYGELAFLYQMEDKSEDLKKCFNDIISLGFDIEILKKVI